MDTSTETNRQVMKQRKKIQATGTTTKPQQLRTTCKRQETKTGTKGAQTEGSTEENE